MPQNASLRLVLTLLLGALCVLTWGAPAAQADEVAPARGTPAPPPPSLPDDGPPLPALPWGGAAPPPPAAPRLPPDGVADDGAGGAVVVLADEDDDAVGDEEGAGDEPEEKAVEGAAGGEAGDALPSATSVLESVPDGVTVHEQRIVREKGWHGNYRLTYRMRSTDDDADHDLYQYLLLHVGKEENYGFSAAFHGRLTADLDGRSDDRSSFYVFDSITDTFKQRLNGHIYHAYASYRAQRGPIDLVRVGRQDVEAGELFFVDAARVDTRKVGGRAEVQVSVFGGVPAHLFEGSPDGDYIAGVTVSGKPWRGAEASASYVRLQDRTRYYGEEINDFFNVTLRQQFSRGLSAWGSYQHLNGDPRQATFGLTHADTRRDVFVRAFFNALLTRQNDLAYDFDPFFAVALQLEPYWDGSVSVSKGIGERFFVEGGVALRRLFDEADEGRYNHSFERYFLILSTDNWPCRNLYLSATGERWQSDDSAYSVGFEVEHRPSKRFRVQAGTDYALYRFDLYTADERQSSRGYYLRVRYKATQRLDLQVRVRVDHDAFDTYTTLLTGFDWDF